MQTKKMFCSVVFTKKLSVFIQKIYCSNALREIVIDHTENIL